MRFSASTLVMLGSLVQAQAQLHRIVGANDAAAKEPFIVKSTNMHTLDDPPLDPEDPSLRFNGPFTSFSVIEGTGCPAGTFTPQPIEPGKTLNTYVTFDNFVFNSTTSGAPVTCSLKFEFEFTYPERGYGVFFPQVSTETETKYEENDAERGTNFNLGHVFNLQAGNDGLDNAGLTYTVVHDGPAEMKTGAYVEVSGTPGEKGVGSFQLDYSMYTSFGPGEMKVTRTTLGWGLWE